MKPIIILNNPEMLAFLPNSIDRRSPEYRAIQEPYKYYRQMIGTLHTRYGKELIPLSKPAYMRMITSLKTEMAILFILAAYHGPIGIANLLVKQSNQTWIDTLFQFDGEVLNCIYKLHLLGRFENT